MPRPDRLTDLVEQLELLHGWRCRCSVFDTQPAIDHGKRLVAGSACVDGFHRDHPPRYGMRTGFRHERMEAFKTFKLFNHFDGKRFQKFQAFQRF